MLFLFGLNRDVGIFVNLTGSTISRERNIEMGKIPSQNIRFHLELWIDENGIEEKNELMMFEMKSCWFSRLVIRSVDERMSPTWTRVCHISSVTLLSFVLLHSPATTEKTMLINLKNSKWRKVLCPIFSLPDFTYSRSSAIGV